MDKHYPSDQQLTFLVCEEARQEQGGTLTLLGFTPGNRIFLPETAVEKSGKHVIPRLALVATFNDGEGEFDGTISLMSPSGKEIIPHREVNKWEKQADGALILIMAFQPFMAEVGIYVATFTFDTKVFTRSLTVAIKN